MNLYVWENVLSDCTPGIIVVMAATREEAVATFRKKHLEEEGYPCPDADPGEPSHVIDMTEASDPRCWFVYGGG